MFPTFPAGTPGTDWNDLAQAIGRPWTAGQLEVALAVGKREHTVLGLSAARDVVESREQERGWTQSLGRALDRIGEAFSRTPARELGHGQGR